MTNMAASPAPRYEQIGRGYARTRREDPRLARRIHHSLGDARTIVNIGAGTGSYEPRDPYVLAIEPSDVMAGQRPPELPPAIRAGAGRLPLRDQSVDAAMAILTVDHWDEEQEAGVREMRRVARGAVVILTYDAETAGSRSPVRPADARCAASPNNRETDGPETGSSPGTPAHGPTRSPAALLRAACSRRVKLEPADRAAQVAAAEHGDLRCCSEAVAPSSSEEAANRIGRLIP